ncbi:MAG: ROK family protein [Thaumarchaeota archaeon]|nr:ROK family protein [Nitrososphaerota archaeon]
MADVFVIGVDIGATNIRVARSDMHGKVLKIIKVKNKAIENPPILPLLVADLIREVGEEGVGAIGVGSIGPLRVSDGSIIPPNLGNRPIKIKPELERIFDIPVFLTNDCISAVIAEKLLGEGKNYDNLVYITFSTGIGAGVIVDGKILSGKDGNAHEVGHLVLDVDDRVRCKCGGYSHWEAFCSGSSIIPYASFLSDKLHLPELGAKTPEALFKLAREGNQIAQIVTERCALINAAGIASVINAYDPSLVTIGGSLALLNPDFYEPMLGNLQQFLTNRMPKAYLTHLGEDIVLKGALEIAKDPGIIQRGFN